MIGPEEDIGLDFLFRLRGAREVPSDIVVVTLDKKSADKLNLPPEPYKWPRSLHARLIENLAGQGAAVIAFDMIFKEPGPAEIDNLFAEAMHSAGNVVLCEQLDTDTVPLVDENGSHTGGLKFESLVPLIPCLEKAAIAAAPFPLPKVPVKVSQYWTFKSGAGDLPTFPVVAFQVFALDVYDDFIRLLEHIDPVLFEPLPKNRAAAVAAGGVESLLRDLRHVFVQDPSVGQKMLKALDQENTFADDLKKRQILRSLIKMYQGGNSHYLNFYGPPGAIHTVPYYQLISSTGEAPFNRGNFNMSGKAVFVGLSERLRPEEKDGFYTAYSQSSGVDISGVEIAATAFANLLENVHVRPFSLRAHTATVLLGGLILGIFCRISPTVVAAAGVVGMSALYVGIAHYQFKAAGLWSPLVLPILVQAPLAFFGTVLWKYLETHKERQNVRKALGYYVPGGVVDQMTKNMADIRESKRVFRGTCLCTDAKGYTTLSETLEPEAMAKVMNEYFEVVFEPVKRHKGTVSEVVGDSMIAIWESGKSEKAHRINACQAALGIAGAVNRFNESNTASSLPTRIGLHTGHMMVGNIGAIDRYEYNPIGDIVNTASRIEGLNKHLGTWILATQEVVYDLDDFLTRELGAFILKGKSKPVVVYELMCLKEEAGEQQKRLCSIFPEALAACRTQSWKEGMEMFSELAATNGKDGPSRFYLDLCNKHEKDSSVEEWDGVVRLDEK
jgi:adenylate cyclase